MVAIVVQHSVFVDCDEPMMLKFGFLRLYTTRLAFIISLLIAALLIGCSNGDPVQTLNADAVTLVNSDANSLRVRPEGEATVRTTDEKVTLSPKSWHVFSGELQWAGDSEQEILLFELQRTMKNGRATTIANGAVRIEERVGDKVSFTVRTNIGDLHDIDCEVVLISLRRTDGHQEVLLREPIRIGG